MAVAPGVMPVTGTAMDPRQPAMSVDCAATNLQPATPVTRAAIARVVEPYGLLLGEVLAADDRPCIPIFE